MNDQHDWRDQLITARVLLPTGQIDASGNVVYYYTGEFPAGKEGARLRKLFDQHVRQAK